MRSVNKLIVNDIENELWDSFSARLRNAAAYYIRRPLQNQVYFECICDIYRQVSEQYEIS